MKVPIPLPGLSIPIPAPFYPWSSGNKSADKAYIFDVKRDCSEDGPGIRTTVFFKGCPLSCDWCQNPEGKTDSVEIAFHEEKCQPELCGLACVQYAQSAVSVSQNH